MFSISGNGSERFIAFEIYGFKAANDLGRVKDLNGGRNRGIGLALGSDQQEALLI